MNSYHCRWWLSAVIVLFAASAQAERMPVTISMTALSDLGPNTNRPFMAVAPNTLTLLTRQRSETYTELTLSGIAPDSPDRMLNYEHGDPPSREWTITADNAADFGVNWLEFQSHLNQLHPFEVSTSMRFFHPSPPDSSNPVANGFGDVSDLPPNGGWATDFQLHEVNISVDYYFWHDILEGLRSVRIQADIRGEAEIREIPEPRALKLLSLGLILLGRVARRRGVSELDVSLRVT